MCYKMSNGNITNEAILYLDNSWFPRCRVDVLALPVELEFVWPRGLVGAHVAGEAQTLVDCSHVHPDGAHVIQNFIISFMISYFRKGLNQIPISYKMDGRQKLACNA